MARKPPILVYLRLRVGEFMAPIYQPDRGAQARVWRVET
jgi:hypothetical protein